MLQFNTLAFSNALVDGGMDRRTAETVASAQHELISELAAKNLPSRDDVNDLRILIETRMVALTAANERIVQELRADLDTLRGELHAAGRDIAHIRTSAEGIGHSTAGLAEVKATLHTLSEAIERRHAEMARDLPERLSLSQRPELIKLREALFDKMQTYQDRRDHSAFLMVRAIRNKLLLLAIAGLAALLAAGYFTKKYFGF